MGIAQERQLGIVPPLYTLERIQIYSPPCSPLTKMGTGKRRQMGGLHGVSGFFAPSDLIAVDGLGYCQVIKLDRGRK